MKLRHVEITVLTFVILLVLYSVKFRGFNFACPIYFASIKKSKKSRKREIKLEGNDDSKANLYRGTLLFSKRNETILLTSALFC